jgi:hypothetical protein
MRKDLICGVLLLRGREAHSLRAHQEAAEAFGAECIVVKPPRVRKSRILPLVVVPLSPGVLLHHHDTDVPAGCRLG